MATNLLATHRADFDLYWAKTATRPFPHSEMLCAKQPADGRHWPSLHLAEHLGTSNPKARPHLLKSKIFA